MPVLKSHKSLKGLNEVQSLLVSFLDFIYSWIAMPVMFNVNLYLLEVIQAEQQLTCEQALSRGGVCPLAKQQYA